MNNQNSKVGQRKLHWVAFPLLVILPFLFFSVFLPPLPPIHSAAGGEIFDQCVADNDEAFTEKDVIRLAKQILTGVAFLHRNDVVHLDLKVSGLSEAYVNIEARLCP